jgi:hypothetical protein
MDRKQSSNLREGTDRHDEPTSSQPTWRSVQVASREPSLAGNDIPITRKPLNSDVIDKSSFFEKATANDCVASLPTLEERLQDNRAWVPTKLRSVPAFYPLEKSSRFIDDELSYVTERLSECFRILSVQAIYNNDTATAYLITAENVEMHLSLWKASNGSDQTGIVVELQRRKGDSIAFHRYSRYILDAAIGEFDMNDHISRNGADFDFVYSKKVQRLLSLEMGKATEHENAIIAVEIAHGLLMKDRMDARQLGLESLCLLTDPKKTGISTAVIASHVVLLGTAQGVATITEEGLMFDEAPFQEIRDTILSLVQFSRIGEEDFEEVESADDDFEGRQLGEGQHMSLLHNLALAVLANALDVLENRDMYEENPEETKKPASTEMKSALYITEKFLSDSTEISETEILGSLIRELGKAERNPHNACLSARCLGSLCGASTKAKKRAKELGAKNVVSSAIEVGVRTHLRLQTESNRLEKVLTSLDEEE